MKGMQAAAIREPDSGPRKGEGTSAKIVQRHPPSWGESNGQFSCDDKDLREALAGFVEKGEQYASEARRRLHAFSEAIEREITLLHRLRQLLSPGTPENIPPEEPDAGLPAPVASPKATPVTLPNPASHAQASSLCVYCLGEFRVLREEEPVQHWPGGKARAVFKYLLLHRRAPVAREVLMQQFWPDSPPDGARNNLNVAIYSLRKSIGQPQPGMSALVFAEGHYQLNPDMDIWVDREDFLDHAQAGKQLELAGKPQAAIDAYLHAQALYCGPLLVEDIYDDWLQEERAHLQETALNVLRQLSGLFRQTGDERGGIDSLRRLLELDPCDEPAHRELMRLYARRGDAHLALRQFKHCADALARGLHMIPSPETVNLLHQIRRRETV